MFTGHLDTYPLSPEDHSNQHLNLGVLRDDGRVYGRGACDMKGGIAASLTAAKVLAENRDLWRGEILVVLAGDEENMGDRGAKDLLDRNVDGVREADAMICGDVSGGPRVVRFGEKGFVWITLEAEGVAAHGAHMHCGVNAIKRLRGALDAIESLEGLGSGGGAAPEEVKLAIASAAGVSEKLSGQGETETLQRVTVNVGTISGGVSPNLIPNSAKAECDIRIPLGVTTEDVLRKLSELLDPMEGIRWSVIRQFDPNYTSPEHDIIQLGVKIGKEVTGRDCVANMRVGASDSRWYRAAGVPTVVVGCSGGNMGAANEYVAATELVQVAQVHTLMAYDFLRKSS